MSHDGPWSRPMLNNPRIPEGTVHESSLGIIIIMIMTGSSRVEKCWKSINHSKGSMVTWPFFDWPFWKHLETSIQILQYFQVQNGGNAISVYYVMHPKTKCYSNMIIIMISMIILMIVETWHGLRINSITNQVSSDFFISPDHDSGIHMGMGQNPGTFCSPQVIAGLKWMFIPLKMVFS